jgi:hypothetical protein
MRAHVAVLTALGFVAAPVRPTVPHERASLLRVVATEYALVVSAVPRSGIITARLVNHGKETHHFVISPVPDTLSLQRYYDLAFGIVPSPLVRDIGGPNMTRPGDSSEIRLSLRPGRYIVSCWIIATDGKPHIMHGMLSEFRIALPVSTSSPPSQTMVVRSSDYRFDVKGRWREGTNTIEFENDGPQEHDLQVVRLADNQTTEDIRSWAESGGVGAPHAAIVGGSSGIEKGQRTWFSVRLTPGRYAIFCFVPDIKDGKMHLLHGMLKEFTVSEN